MFSDYSSPSSSPTRSSPASPYTSPYTSYDEFVQQNRRTSERKRIADLRNHYRRLVGDPCAILPDLTELKSAIISIQDCASSYGLESAMKKHNGNRVPLFLWSQLLCDMKTGELSLRRPKVIHKERTRQEQIGSEEERLEENTSLDSELPDLMPPLEERMMDLDFNETSRETTALPATPPLQMIPEPATPLQSPRIFQSSNVSLPFLSIRSDDSEDDCVITDTFFAPPLPPSPPRPTWYRQSHFIDIEDD